MCNRIVLTTLCDSGSLGTIDFVALHSIKAAKMNKSKRKQRTEAEQRCSRKTLQDGNVLAKNEGIICILCAMNCFDNDC